MKNLLLILLALCALGCEPPQQHSLSQPPSATWTDSIQVLAFHYDPCVACDNDESDIVDLKNRGVRVTTVQHRLAPNLFQQYRVEQTPTYVILRDGVEISRFPSMQGLRTALHFLLPLLF